MINPHDDMLLAAYDHKVSDADGVASDDMNRLDAAALINAPLAIPVEHQLLSRERNCFGLHPLLLRAPRNPC
jgi:hypothetical protein